MCITLFWDKSSTNEKYMKLITRVLLIKLKLALFCVIFNITAVLKP